MRLTSSLAALALAATTALTALPGWAAEVTLKFHQFLPADSFIPAKVLIPWIDRIEKDSGGRIAVERYDSMALGGKPADLADQAADGVVDVIWTLPGYTPGRFPRTEVMELPFLSKDSSATAKALWRLSRDFPESEYAGLHVLGLWVHSPSVIHSAKPVETLEDLTGMAIRAPSRNASMLLEKLGATPVGMPAPQITEALSKGVIAGALLPWEVTSSVRVSELVHNHTQTPDRAMYVGVQMVAMNKDAYDRLPDDLKKVIDDASGEAFSAHAALIQQEADAPMRDAATAAGDKVITLTDAEAARWQEKGAEVVAAWVAQAAGFDGAALVDAARAAIAKAEAE